MDLAEIRHAIEELAKGSRQQRWLSGLPNETSWNGTPRPNAISPGEPASRLLGEMKMDVGLGKFCPFEDGRLQRRCYDAF
jgi:hypothetical protein